MDVILAGSSTLTSTLLEHGLADEVNLLVYPVLLGKGKRFLSSTPTSPLDLCRTRHKEQPNSCRRLRRIAQTMTNQQAREFAQRWADLWNKRDVEGVLAHFADDVVFSSPVALKVTGNACVEGKDALRAYWTQALDSHPVLQFAVVRTLCDSTSDTVAIIYDRDINGRHDRAVEILTFGTSGTIARGEALYGVIPHRS